MVRNFRSAENPSEQARLQRRHDLERVPIGGRVSANEALIMTKTKHSSARDPLGAARPTSIRMDIPRAFSNGGSCAIWKPGGPGRMLGQLAREHATGEATLTPQQLADLLDLFSDEPLPDSLRTAITRHLRGKRKRLSGAPKKGTTNREQVERVMLPGAYEEALMEARTERSKLRTFGRKQSRYDDPDRLPIASAMALEKVRRRLHDDPAAEFGPPEERHGRRTRTRHRPPAGVRRTRTT